MSEELGRAVFVLIPIFPLTNWVNNTQRMQNLPSANRYTVALAVFSATLQKQVWKCSLRIANQFRRDRFVINSTFLNHEY